VEIANISNSYAFWLLLSFMCSKIYCIWHHWNLIITWYYNFPDIKSPPPVCILVCTATSYLLCHLILHSVETAALYIPFYDYLHYILCTLSKWTKKTSIFHSLNHHIHITDDGWRYTKCNGPLRQFLVNRACHSIQCQIQQLFSFWPFG
jgi:hypothetical protein